MDRKLKETIESHDNEIAKELVLIWEELMSDGAYYQETDSRDFAKGILYAINVIEQHIDKITGLVD